MIWFLVLVARKRRRFVCRNDWWVQCGSVGGFFDATPTPFQEIVVEKSDNGPNKGRMRRKSKKTL